MALTPLASPYCPRCGGNLDRDRSRDHVKPRVCASGHGVFLDADEVDVVFDPSSAAPLRAAVSTAPLGDAACPRCGKAMRAFPLAFVAGDRPGVMEVDGCLDCGTFWFDGGELDAVGGPRFAPREAPPRPTISRRDVDGATPPSELRGWRQAVADFVTSVLMFGN